MDPQTVDPHPSAIIARLKAERGLNGIPTNFSPSAFPDLPRALERIRSAEARGEKIGIFGDYDCDGITATALLVRSFRRRGVEPHVILPHRARDGYGLKAHIIERFRKHNVTLLITVDTGITAIAEVAEAQRSGIDVIVTDHHHPQAEVPAAYAILHPALSPAFPNPHPSGAGVAYLLVSALEGAAQWPDRTTDSALAAMGTVADLVPLTGGNRTLVIQGLAALNDLSEGPLALLATRVRSKGQPLTSTDIAFRLAPRINAAGRMEDPTIALRALLEGGPFLQELERLNGERQQSMQDVFERALASFPASAELPPLLSLADASFSEGLIGLVAGKLTEMTGRPSMVAAIRGEECTASLRSTHAYHITAGLERCGDILATYGGHAQAAGCTFSFRHWEVLRSKLAIDIAERTRGIPLLPSLELTAALEARDLSLTLCERLRELEPFGQGNPEPLFLLPNVRAENARRVGGDGAHLQARIAGMKAIGWRLGHLIEHTAKPLDLACRLGIDTWNGRRAPQIVMEDIRSVIHQKHKEHAMIASHETN